jgi:putative nucleotidyltransferase with HDIG domain
VGRVPIGASPGHTEPMTVGGPLGSVWHLVARFVTSLPPTPPSVVDEVWAEDRLLPGERRLWTRMSNQDRRHSIAVARRFVDARPGASRAEIAGAILHDVGKIECGLGTFGRVAATLVGPRTRAFQAYHDHEEIGAEMARRAGSEPATVELIAQRGPAFDTLEASDHA